MEITSIAYLVISCCPFIILIDIKKPPIQGGSVCRKSHLSHSEKGGFLRMKEKSSGTRKFKREEIEK